MVKQTLFYYKNPVKGAVTVEFDYKPNAWNAQWGFGLVSSTTVGAFSSKVFYAQTNEGGVKNGVSIYYRGKTIGNFYRVYDENGAFIALTQADIIDERECLRLIKGFYK